MEEIRLIEFKTQLPLQRNVVASIGDDVAELKHGRSSSLNMRI
jgi:hypothetical protein